MSDGTERPMGDKKRGLGRGLSALLDDVGGAVGPDDAGSGMRDGGVKVTASLPLARIVANPRQPRRRFDGAAMDELIASVKRQGLLQPILVRPRGDQFEIVAGERRWRAAQAAQLHEVPVVVRPLDDAEAFEIALVENIQRADLNPIEEADGYRRLVEDFGHTQEELGRLVGKSRSHVANLMRLLDLPAEIRELVIDGELAMGHARALLSADDPIGLARKAAAQKLSVRQVEALAAGRVAPGRPPRPRRDGSGRDADVIALERQLADALGLAVALDYGGAGGRIEIAFNDLDQLDMLCQRLLGGGRF